MIINYRFCHRAIQQLPNIIGPFFHALSEATGWAFTLLLGGPDPHDAKGDINVARYDNPRVLFHQKSPVAA